MPGCVCFCNSTIAWGGGEKWHLEAALSLAARGWRVFLVCHPRSELYAKARGFAALTLVPLPLGRLSFLNPLASLRLTRLFREEGVTALLMNLPADLKVAGPAARRAGVPRIIYRRGSALPVRDSFLNRWLYGRVITRLIVNSEATRRQALVNNPDLLPTERICVLPNGIDVEAFDGALRAAGGASPVRPFLGGFGSGVSGSGSAGSGSTGSRPFILGNAGRLTAQKGQHLLLHLCRRLLDAGLDCAVVIAGSGEREAELKALAQALELGERAVFPGFLDDLSAFWRGIDLFVLSSLWEGFGNVLIEAMLAGKPVFAFAVSNIPELVFEDSPDRPGREDAPGRPGNGRLFALPEEERERCPDLAHPASQATPSPVDPLSTLPRPSETPLYADLAPMVAAVLELAADPEQAARMGEAGRAFALRFSQDACMDRLEALLSSECR